MTSVMMSGARGWWCVVVAALVLGLSGTARGQMTGAQVVADYSAAVDGVADDFEVLASDIAAEAVARLAQMDAQGQPAAKLEAYAAKCQAKVAKTANKCRSVTVKLTQRGFNWLIKLDEMDLIAQMTMLNTARLTAVAQITMGQSTYEDQIAAALAMELMD